MTDITYKTGNNSKKNKNEAIEQAISTMTAG